MKLYIRSLFWKIFLWFWATVIVIAFSLVVTFLFDPGKSSSRWHESLTRLARYSGTAAIEEAELHGVPAASAYLKDLGNTTHLHACLLDEAGDVIAGDSCDLFARNISLARSTHNISVFLKDGIARVALPISSTNGRRYIYAAEIPVAAPGISKTAIAIRLCLAFFVSFCICYLLTRYLTAPILRLREASHRLAAGDLSTRASGSMERRNDELGFLVRDFNAMAGRMEELISRQKQLIYDVSHELRSPLARLNVALDLGRKRKGNDSAFDHMEHDLELMSEMIGRMLTLAKLDSSSTEVHMTRVDLGELASRVVRSAEFELRERANAVRFTMREQCFVHGNAQLLQSAIENVVRNAVRYTTPDASVDVHLQRVEKIGGGFILLSVRDYGTGVPESELSDIFRPFYRVANDRDRQSGGAGLGLAIADRVIRVHGGTIHAENASPRGLRVDILLPAGEK
jgi:two-component system, OmpR family, sensor histidine kinase CpxA